MTINIPLIKFIKFSYALLSKSEQSATILKSSPVQVLQSNYRNMLINEHGQLCMLIF